METTIPAFAAILLGLAGLVWGADRFVSGSAGAARNLGVSPLVIGLTIVSIGTSAPEIIVSINAALKGAGQLAVGNALGSNLANIGLVLGLTAIIAPLPTQRHLLTQEGSALLVITALAGIILFDGQLRRGESLPLLLAVVPLVWLTVKYKKHHPSPEELEEGEDIPAITTSAALLWLITGLGALLASSEVLVWGATTVAREAGISELVIGLTIVAIGTSLPELAASAMSALRGHHDIAIGNIFGSNLFNLMVVMPIAGAIAPLNLGPEVFYRDFVALAIMTILLFIAVMLAQKKHTKTLGKPVGITLLALYFAYGLWLIPGAG
ncbi:MAG: calcium/sodium antiporter [Porticoccaceae bacterium]|nr:calcium/sodium antiporter [Porticoccaceae bacterium]